MKIVSSATWTAAGNIVTNIWRGTELGFNADETYYTSMIGKTVTQITYYTANGVYVLPVNVAIPALAD